MFRRLVFVCLCSFPACWRQANVTLISKSLPSYILLPITFPISITSVLSKVFERQVSVCLGHFLERTSVLPNTLFAYRKGLGTCNAFFCLFHTLRGRIGKVVASHAAVARSSPADVALIYTTHVALRGYCR